MRVLVVSNLYPPHSLGGYELSCRDVVRRWRTRGHEVEVLTTTTRFAAAAAEPDEPGVHRVLGWYWADGELVRPPALERVRIERANRRHLADLLDRLRPDVVSLWAMGGMSMSLVSMCLARRQPTVAVIEDEWLGYGPALDAWTSAWSSRPGRLARLAAAVTGIPTGAPTLPEWVTVAFASDYLRRRAETDGRIGFATAAVVPLGIDPEDFPLRRPDERPWRGALLCVGRIEARKGFDTAVRALAELPDATLQLVGPDGGQLGDLQELARELGVAARLTHEVVPREQLASRYAAADVMIFPSRWEEPFGLVPLEAMSQATPVVATRRGGSAEFLADDSNCLEVPVDDPAAVAAAVRRLAADPALRDRLRRAGLAAARDHDVARFADRLEDLHLAAAAPPTAPALETLRSPAYDGPTPEVSVVVSTHGRDQLLAGLLDALEQQVGVDAEVVVVDNGSTDGTWRVLGQRAAATTMRLLAIRVGYHDGPGVPRNTAAQAARAGVIAFTDDDCLPAADWLRELIRPFADAEVVVVQGTTVPEPGGWGGPWGRTVTVTAASGLFETANLACRREAFVAAGGFSRRRLLTGRAFGEDVQLGAALTRAGGFRFAGAAVVHHRVMPGTYRDFLTERSRLAGFPALVREVPELRRRLLLRTFLGSRTLTADVAVAGAAVAVASGRPEVAVLGAPWLWRCWALAAERPGRPRVVRAAQVAVGDVVGLAALVGGSARARRLVL